MIELAPAIFVVTYYLKQIQELFTSTAVGQVVACMPVMQRAQVQFPVGTSFLGEVFLGFFLTCKTKVRKL